MSATRIWRASYCRTYFIFTTGSKCSPIPWSRPPSQNQRRIKNCNERRQGVYFDMRSETNDEVYRLFQQANSWRDAWVRYSDFIVYFDISHNTPVWQRKRYVNLIHLRILCRTRKRDIMGATWRIQGIKMSSRMSSECRNTRSSPHSSECQDSLAKWNRSCIARMLGMINSSLETALCGFEKFKTQHNIKDVIIPGPKLAEMTVVWVARRRAVIQKVRKIMSDSRSKWSLDTVGKSEKVNVVQVHTSRQLA